MGARTTTERALPMSSGDPTSSTASQPALLQELLSPVVADRVSSAAKVVHKTSKTVRDWLAGRPEEEVAGSTLEAALEGFSADQGWRGPCSLWLDSLRRTLSFAARIRRPARDVLEGELGNWLFDRERGYDEELSERAAREHATRDEPAWDGEPLSPGRRLPSRWDLARAAAVEIDPDDTVLVTAWSETVALALEAAWRAGRRPKVLLPEGAPDLDGRRMARRLTRSGVATTLVYDSAVPSLVPRVDQVWLSTEAIGAGAFVARRGTQTLLEECSRRDVRVRVLATSDKLVPGGALRLPEWAEREGWRLWEDAPDGVRLESQFYEIVPTALLELVGGFVTEVGPEAVAAMHVRALRIEETPPVCGAVGGIAVRARP